MPTGEHAKRVLLLITALLLIAVLALSGILSLGLRQEQTENGFVVQISEIMASNSICPAPDGQYHDWIELHNTAPSPVDLSGYHLTDNDRNVKFTFPEGTVLDSDEYLVVWCDSNADSAFGFAPFSVASEGDEVIYLINRRNITVDIAYTIAAGRNKVLVRNANSDWSVSSRPTPGFPNNEAGYAAYQQSLHRQDPLVLSEIMSSNTLYPSPTGFADWIELHNTGTETISLAGYRLSDAMDKPKYTFPDDAVISAGGYYVVWCEPPVSFSLSRSGGETVCLQAEDGSVIETVTLPALTQNESYARVGETWQIVTPATPGYSNDKSGYDAYVASMGYRHSDVVISEVMPDNRGCLPDENGCFLDWVELTNSGNTVLSLSGWCLSDDPDEPWKWQFPDVTLAPGQYLIVFCGGNTIDKTLHTSFSLSPGETLVLSTPIGSPADLISFSDSLGPDRSLFRCEDGSFLPTDAPTPGYPNTDAGREALLASRTVNRLGINEVMSANDRYLPQSADEYPDWAELKNFSDKPISLSGWSLTDNPEEPKKYVLPEVFLQPGSLYLLLFSTEPISYASYSVVPFSLNAQEDWLYLYDENGVLVDYVHLTDIPYQGSMGRQDDDWYYFTTPTPGAQNKEGRRGVSPLPTVSAAPGIYDNIDEFSVSLSAPGDIYYTLDGSLPTIASTLYTAPLTITKTTVLRALCVEPGCVPSPAATWNYIVNEGHTLPIVCLSTNQEALFGNSGIYRNYYSGQEILANISYYEHDGGTFSSDCGLTMFGSMSLQTSPKKSFKLLFRPRYGGPVEYQLFDTCDVSTFSQLVLRAGQDWSMAMIREGLMTSLADDASPSLETQHFRYCILYINGSYFGIYDFKEAFSQETYAAHHGVTPESVTMLRVTTVSPSTEVFSLMQTAREKDMTKQENYAAVADRVDVDSLIDWIIFEAYCGNSDVRNNVRYFKSTQDNGLWHWAFFDLDWTFLVHNNITSTALESGAPHAVIAEGLLENPEFRDRFLRRLAELLKTTLSQDNVFARIDALAEELRPEMARERKQWGASTEDWQASLHAVKTYIASPGRAREVADDFSRYFGLTVSQQEDYFGGLPE